MTTKIWYEIQTDVISFAQWSDNPNGRVVWIGQDKFHRMERGELMPKDGIHQLVAPQEMIDELWRLGYRPAESVGTAGHVGALERHIKFAERIADGLLTRVTHPTSAGQEKP